MYIGLMYINAKMNPYQNEHVNQVEYQNNEIKKFHTFTICGDL